MKVLLVRPPSNSYIVIPPINLGYIARSLIREDYKVRILDCLKSNTSYGQFRKIVKEIKPDVVGFEAFSYQIQSVQKCIEIVKGLDNDIVTLVGGPHVSGDPEHALNFFDGMDLGIRGEAEIILPEILSKIESDMKLSDTRGVCLKSNEGFTINEPLFVENLDKLGFPAWELIKPQTYTQPHGGFYKDYPSAPIITSRGCPFFCTFCAASSTLGEKVRFRSPKHVVKEIEFLHENYGVKEIHIEDDNFTMDKERVKSICRLIRSRNLDLNFSCPNGVRIDSLDRELLEEMRRTGFYSLAVGIEFGSEKVLNQSKKGLEKSAIKEKVRLIKKMGFEVVGFFILGYPTENVKDIKKTLKFAKELEIDKAAFSIFLPLPGSEIYKEIKEKSPISWGKMTNNEVPWFHPKISPSKLKKLQRYCYLSFYLRPKQILKLGKYFSGVRNFLSAIRLTSHFLR